MAEPLTIAGRELRSRLIIGTGGFRSLDTLSRAVTESGAEIATVALRRIDASAQGSVLDVLRDQGLFVLPNTAGCFTARDAVTTARLGREALGTDWVKLEVIGDDKTLLPDPAELLDAAETLVGRRLHGAAVHKRRPGARPAPRGGGLRGRDAARLADRQRHGHPQPVQPPPDRRERGCAGDPRRWDRDGVGRDAGDGARLRRRPARERDIACRGSDRDGARHAAGGRGRRARARSRADTAAPLRRGLEPGGGRARS